jgi:hypothetical protein
MLACVDFSMAELLRGGATTVLEIGSEGEYVVERAAHYGLRVYMGLAFRSGRWLTRDGRRVEWEWDEEAGRRGLARAIDFHDKYDGAHGDLVRCAFAPAQIDTCTAQRCRGRSRAAHLLRLPAHVLDRPLPECEKLGPRDREDRGLLGDDGAEVGRLALPLGSGTWRCAPFAIEHLEAAIASHREMSMVSCLSAAKADPQTLTSASGS